jgi:hypothetical protein
MKRLACILFAEALSAPEVAWALVDAGFEVIAIARKGRGSALRHSVHVEVLEITPPELDTAVALADAEQVFKLRSCRTGGPGVILPLDDASVWLCSQVTQASGWVLAGPHGTMAELALNKDLQVRAAATAGLRVPVSTIAHTVPDVLARSNELPLVLRPANAVMSGNRRLYTGRKWICGTRSELNRMLADWAEAWPLLVQPFIRGTGEGVFGLATDEGVQGWSAHRRLRMMNPHGSGSSACVSQIVPTEIALAIQRLIDHTGWRGLFMVELIRDEAGVLWFVEFNGRAWGSMALSRRQGLEYPVWAAERALQQVPNGPFVPAPYHHRVCRHVGREFMHLLYVLRGPKSEALTEWPSFWGAVREVVWWGRGEGVYNWRRDDVKVFLMDWWYTVRDNTFKSRG